MRTIRIHPIQLAYAASLYDQTYGLCSVEELSYRPSTSTEALQRSLHLVHLVRAHLVEVNRTFTAAGRAEESEIKVSESGVSDG